MKSFVETATAALSVVGNKEAISSLNCFSILTFWFFSSSSCSYLKFITLESNSCSRFKVSSFLSSHLISSLTSMSDLSFCYSNSAERSSFSFLKSCSILSILFESSCSFSSSFFLIMFCYFSRSILTLLASKASAWLCIFSRPSFPSSLSLLFSLSHSAFAFACSFFTESI